MRGSPRAGAVAGHMRAGRCFLLAVAVLAVFNVARGTGLLGPSRFDWVPVSLLVAALAALDVLEEDED